MQDRYLLLDTDVVSLLGKKRPPPGLGPWLLSVGISRLYLSYPVIAELSRGAHLLLHGQPDRAARLFAWLDRLLKTDFPFPPMTVAVAEAYAELTAEPGLRNLWTAERGPKKNTLGHDLTLAALSLAHDCPIITCNVRDYVQINRFFALPGVYHPLEAEWVVPPPAPVYLPAHEPAVDVSPSPVSQIDWNADDAMQQSRCVRSRPFPDQLDFGL